MTTTTTRIRDDDDKLSTAGSLRRFDSQRPVLKKPLKFTIWENEEAKERDRFKIWMCHCEECHENRLAIVSKSKYWDEAKLGCDCPSCKTPTRGFKKMNLPASFGPNFKFELLSAVSVGRLAKIGIFVSNRKKRSDEGRNGWADHHEIDRRNAWAEHIAKNTYCCGIDKCGLPCNGKTAREHYMLNHSKEHLGLCVVFNEIEKTKIAGSVNGDKKKCRYDAFIENGQPLDVDWVELNDNFGSFVFERDSKIFSSPNFLLLQLSILMERLKFSKGKDKEEEEEPAGDYGGWT
jgi:hypothetical protein